jgi:hypothetical protein
MKVATRLQRMRLSAYTRGRPFQRGHGVSLGGEINEHFYSATTLEDPIIHCLRLRIRLKQQSSFLFQKFPRLFTRTGSGRTCRSAMKLDGWIILLQRSSWQATGLSVNRRPPSGAACLRLRLSSGLVIAAGEGRTCFACVVSRHVTPEWELWRNRRFPGGNVNGMS